MEKFEIRTNEKIVEFENRAELKEGCACDQVNSKLIASYSSEKEAIEILEKKYRTKLYIDNRTFHLQEYWVAQSNSDNICAMTNLEENPSAYSAKYEIRSDRRYIKDKGQIEVGCTCDQVNSEPDLIVTHNTEQEALNDLKNYKSEIRYLDNILGYEVREYWVVETIYDDEGDWAGGGDISEITQFDIV